MIIEPLLSQLSLQDSVDPNKSSISTTSAPTTTATKNHRVDPIDGSGTPPVSIPMNKPSLTATGVPYHRPTSSSAALSPARSAREGLQQQAYAGEYGQHHDPYLTSYVGGISPTSSSFGEPTSMASFLHPPHPHFVDPATSYYLASSSTSPASDPYRPVAFTSPSLPPSPPSSTMRTPPMLSSLPPPRVGPGAPPATGIPFVPTVTPSGWTPDHAKAIASSCHRPEFGAPAHWIIEQLEAGMVIHRLGRCKYFDVVKGFGFILDDNIAELGGRDVFVHFTGISMKAGFRCLSPGEKVEFDLVRAAGGGYQALNVTGAFGRPLIGLTADQYAHHARGELASDRKRGSSGSSDSIPMAMPVIGPRQHMFPHELFGPQYYQLHPQAQWALQQQQQAFSAYRTHPQHHQQQQPQQQQHQHHPHHFAQAQPQKQAPRPTKPGVGRGGPNFWSSTKHRNVLPYFAFSESDRPAVESVGPRCADYAPMFAGDETSKPEDGEQSDDRVEGEQTNESPANDDDNKAEEQKEQKEQQEAEVPKQ